MDDEVDVDDEEADEQPKNKQPRTTPWPCRLQALDLQNRFHFQAREVAWTLNIASIRDMKVTVWSVSFRHCRISSVVRKQPTHRPALRSNLQMSAQGDSIAIT
jgi:hypothetical protein